MLWPDRKLQKDIKTALGLLTLVVLLCTGLFLCFETHHAHCHEKDCPICMCLQQCGETIRLLTGIPAVTSVILPLFFLRGRILRSFDKVSVFDSPVSLKVRLNN